MEDLAREAESAASNQRMGQIYQVTKQLSGRKAQVNMPIKDKNNNTLTTEQEQYLRWNEHFQEVLNRKDPDELAIIPEAPMGLEIDTDPPSKLDIHKFIKGLKNKKVHGTDQLNAELLKKICLIGIKQQSVTHRLMLEMVNKFKILCFLTDCICIAGSMTLSIHESLISSVIV